MDIYISGIFDIVFFFLRVNKKVIFMLRVFGDCRKYAYVLMYNFFYLCVYMDSDNLFFFVGSFRLFDFIRESILLFRVVTVYVLIVYICFV